MVDAVIFDIDGTLIDSVDLHAEAWQVALRHFGHDLPFERVRHEIGKGGDHLMPALLPQDLVDSRGEEIEKFRSELFKREYLSRVRPFPGVRELFERIKADGKRIALASSAKGDEVEIYKGIADIAGLSEAETSSDDAESSKPNPDIFEAAMEQLGDVDSAEVVVIGDTPYDAEAASKAGLRTIGMLCGGFPETELRAAGCFAIYRDPADLLARYDESPLGRLQTSTAP
ncbi:HAD family hydrolase [Singulisphaera sp. PoT]|uniref:HAD family hydrolase n=1 Tax=Singulisphaera sp. PoT TaxID=3411797 RepID=UPI003BF4B5DB